MGVYLMSWVFVLLHPSELLALYEYSTHDLLQVSIVRFAVPFYFFLLFFCNLFPLL